MARRKVYRVQLRRRREGKTDYRKRTRYLLSGLPRLVVRRSNAHYFVHIAVPSESGDITVASAHSKELARDFGWKGHGSCAASAYLTGLLCGVKAKRAGVSKAILDTGLLVPSAGSNVFAVAKGALDAGLEVPCDEGCLPPMERIRGDMFASDPDRFQRFRARAIDLKELPAHFDEVVSKITSSTSEE